MGCGCSIAAADGGVGEVNSRTEREEDALDAPPPATPSARKAREEDEDGVGPLERRHAVSRPPCLPLAYRGKGEPPRCGGSFPPVATPLECPCPRPSLRHLPVGQAMRRLVACE